MQSDAELFSQLKSSPEGVSPTGGAALGGGNDWYSKVQQGFYNPPSLQGDQPQEPGFAQNVKTDIGNRAEAIKTSVADTMSGKQNPAGMGVDVPGQVAGMGVDVTKEAMKSLNDVQGGFPQKIGAALLHLFNPQAGTLMDAASSPAAKKISDSLASLAQSHPEAARHLDSVLQMAQALSMVAGGAEVPGAAKEAATTVAEGVAKIPETVKAKAETGAVADWNKPATINKPGFSQVADIHANAATNGHNIGQTLVDNGVKLSDNVQGKNYSTADTAGKIRTDAGKMSTELLRPSLEKADLTAPKTPLQELATQAKSSIDANKYIPAEDKAAAQTNVDKAFTALLKDHPDGMSLTGMHDEKILRDANAKYNVLGTPEANLKAQSNKAIADTLRTAVETKAPKDIPVEAFNKELTKQYQAADYLDALHGKSVPVSMAGKIANTARKVLGAVAGKGLGGGLLGEVGGYHIGGMVESTLANLPTQIRDSMLSNLQTTNPEAFAKIQDYLGSPLIRTRPLELPAGTGQGSKVESGAPIPLREGSPDLGVKAPAPTVQINSPGSKPIIAPPEQGISRTKFANEFGTRTGGGGKIRLTPKKLPVIEGQVVK